MPLTIAEITSSHLVKLAKTRSFENYVDDRLSNKAQRTMEGEIGVLKSFDRFCETQYTQSRDEIVKYVKSITNDDEKEDEIISVLQEWVNHLSRIKKIGTDAIKIYISHVNKYLKYYRIRIDLKEIQYPENFHEEKYSMSLSEVHTVLGALKWKKQGLHISLDSSGARPIEICGLKKKDYTFTGKRWRALIPAILTKKKMARTIFFSVECNQFIGALLKPLNDDDFVWSKQRNIPQKYFDKFKKFKDWKTRAHKHFANVTRKNESALMGDTVDKIGLGMKFETTGFHKINLYCYRGRFFTKASRILGDETAHAIIGHGAYLQVYQRRNDEEKEELYEELESELLIYDQTKNLKKIKTLKEANTKFADQAEEIKDLQTIVKDLNRKWHQENILRTKEN